MTKQFYEFHQREQPITHNSMISTSLLVEQKPQISFKIIKEICDDLYSFVMIRKLKSYMGNKPQMSDINNHVKSLGFSVTGKPTQKDAKVDLRKTTHVLKT